MRYKIHVKVLQGKVFTWTISKYPELKKGRILFIDENTGKKKNFASENVEIEEVEL